MHSKIKTLVISRGMRLMILPLIITISVIALTSCSENKNSVDSSKLQITVSFNAMREFAEAIGGDKVQITTMIPDGTEPHDYDPKPKDLISLSKSKVFIYNGLGMELWSTPAINAVGNKNLITVDASKGAEMIKSADEESIKAQDQYDPHLWLSLKGAELEGKNIKLAIEKADSKNKDYYEKNYNIFYSDLENLYNTYKGKFESVKEKDFVTGHAAFGYLCREFGLEQKSVEGIFAEGEPSALKLKELVDYCKKNDIKTIFMENMTSPKVSETLAKEVGAKSEVIYTMESREDNKDYLDCMEINLGRIYDSLK